MGKRLGWCSICKENSVAIKVYRRKDGSQGRVEFCLNKGCGYKLALPGIDAQTICAVAELSKEVIQNVEMQDNTQDIQSWQGKRN